MKKINIKSLLMVLLTFGLLFQTSCVIEEIPNPNGATLESLENGATLADLRLIINGLESVMRDDMSFYYQTVSIVGREYYDLNGIDPRYTGELLGEQGAQLDNNGFLTTRSFAAAYKTIRNAQVLLNALDKTAASLSAGELGGFQGFAKTVQAYMLMQVLNRQYTNGCRLDVADPINPGPFVSYSEGLAGVKSLLDEAATDLSGASFAFFLSAGFGAYGFDEASKFRQFNRALAARVALYQDDMAGVRTALGESFMDMAGDLNEGPAHAFGAGGNDQFNPLFYIPNQDLFTVHPSWLADADSGDLRIAAKTTPLDTAAVDVPVLLAGLTGEVQVTMFASNVSSVPIIRNEELILMYAEANIGNDNDGVINAINTVRAAAGLGDYAGETTDAALLLEVAKQRRYSLFGEGHRWVDMRRWDRLDEIPTDRAGDVVHAAFPIPVTENQ